MILSTTIEESHLIYQKMPEFSEIINLDEMTERAGKNFLSLAYIFKGEKIAFKLGYAESNEQFYSWLGGVLPGYRKSGIAGELIAAQECWAIEQGFKLIRVRSMNRFPSMMRLLISSGYHIESVILGESFETNKIQFFKFLQ